MGRMLGGEAWGGKRKAVRGKRRAGSGKCGLQVQLCCTDYGPSAGSGRLRMPLPRHRLRSFGLLPRTTTGPAFVLGGCNGWADPTQRVRPYLCAGGAAGLVALVSGAER
jgi:hypothetical protein